MGNVILSGKWRNGCQRPNFMNACHSLSHAIARGGGLAYAMGDGPCLTEVTNPLLAWDGWDGREGVAPIPLKVGPDGNGDVDLVPVR